MQRQFDAVTPDVTAAIITHNSASIIDECIESLAQAFAGSGPPRVVVVDSGSEDGTAEHVRARHPGTTVIEMGSNRGFAAGINVAAEHASSDHALLVLNPDIRMEPGSSKAMLQALGDPEVGIVVPRLLDAHGELQTSLRRRPTVQRALGTALLGGRLSNGHVRLSEVVTDRAVYETAATADWATGAALLVSPACRSAVGAWDESYFLYSEETDFCLRAAAAGFRLRLEPTATAVHLGGESTTSPELWALLMRNRVRFVRRSRGLPAASAYWLAATVGETARALAGSERSRAAVRELFSVRPTNPHARAAADVAPAWVCFAAQDWWYHNHGHSDFQLMTRIARDRTVLLVNSIAMRMPTPGRSPQFARRLIRKARSMVKGVRRPLDTSPRFHVLSCVIVPFYGSPIARRVNSALVRAQVRAVCRWLGIREPVIMVTIPTAWEVVAPMKRRALVFNHSDKHSAFGEVAKDFIESLEAELLANSDAVVYVSRSLMRDDAPATGSRAHFLDHGVDLEHFRARPASEHPDDLARIPAPRIGFFGGIDDYVVDLELLAKVARRFPKASLVLIGDATCALPELESLPNVHLLGPRPYAEIPRYGSAFDVALMPWLQNDWIEACNPIKVKEYLALGLPVVTTWYPEVVRYEAVLSTARSHEEFLDAVERVLDGRRPATPEECRASVLDASWDNRASALRTIGEHS